VVQRFAAGVGREVEVVGGDGGGDLAVMFDERLSRRRLAQGGTSGGKNGDAEQEATETGQCV
jgi:hypothetical protein